MLYEELVKRLRNRRICIQQSGSLEDFPLLQEAADAIEELRTYKNIFRLMLDVGGIWGFGQDGRLHHFEVKPPEGVGSVRVYPDKEADDV